MNRTKVGKVALTPKGAYDSGTTYEKLDIVTYDGKAYVVLADVKGVTPADGEDYKLLAKDGYTPQRGKDYWTDEDVASVVADVSEQSKAIVEEAAEAKKNSVLGSIPDDYSTLSKKVNNASNALKGSASGEAIGLNDVSPLEHTMGVKVRSKNLLDISTTVRLVNCKTSVENNQLIVERNNNTGNQNIYYSLGDFKSFAGKTVTLSIKNNGDYNWTITLVGLTSAENNYSMVTLPVSGYGVSAISGQQVTLTYTIPKSEEAVFFGVRMMSNNNDGNVGDIITFDNCQVEIGSSATEYVPFVDVSAVSLNKYGKNLFNYPTFSKATLTEDGIVSFQNAEGTAKVYAYTPFVTFPAGGYIASIDTISLNENGSYAIYVQLNDTNDFTRPLSKNTPSRAFTITKPTRIRLVGEIGVATDVQFKIQMNVGNVIQPFEPYKEPIAYTPNADGTVEGVTSLYPSTTLLTDTEGAVVTCEYNRDINKAFEELTNAIISLGGNV